jgi:transcription initiation factor TFIID TATA-box-binding protein
MSDTKETLAIENVVASTDIGQELDLETVAKDLTGAEYNPDNFPGLVYRTQDPKSAALIFRSGKIVCTGANSTEAVHEALHLVFDKLRELEIQVTDDPEITVQNIVTSADLGHQLNLNAIAIGLGLENIEYEPEQFPGLVYRLDDPDVVALLFGSGKLVITGGKAPDDAEDALVTIGARLEELGLLDN